MNLEEFRKTCNEVLTNPTETVNVIVGEGGAKCPISNYIEESGMVQIWVDYDYHWFNYKDLLRIEKIDKSLEDNLEALAIYSQVHSHGDR